MRIGPLPEVEENILWLGHCLVKGVDLMEHKTYSIGKLVVVLCPSQAP
jgi:hypothetical protein